MQEDRLIQENYRKYPYPDSLQGPDGEDERRHLEVYQLFLWSLNLSLERVTAGLILDIGCGTGDTAIRRFARWGAQVVCLDLSMDPLLIAQAKAEQFACPTMRCVNGSALRLPFADEQFDVVHSCGVLHHTGDTYVGFTEMARVCKRGGILILGLYNKFGGFKRTVQRALLRAVAGSDLEKQMVLASKVFPVPGRGMPVDVYLNDKYGHPLESKHSYGEVLGWFEKHNIEYLGSYPSLYFRKFWNSMLNRAMTSKNPRVQRVAKLVPKIFFKEGVEYKPNLRMKAVGQTFMLLTDQELLNVAGIRR